MNISDIIQEKDNKIAAREKYLKDYLYKGKLVNHDLVELTKKQAFSNSLPKQTVKRAQLELVILINLGYIDSS